MKYLGLCLLLTWQLTWIGVMIACIITSDKVLNYDYKNWLFVLGIVNLATNIVFWLNVVIAYLSQNRAWIILNTALVWIWVVFNLVNSIVGIYLFDQSLSENIEIYNTSIILFVYLGIVLLGGLGGLYYGIYTGKCNKQTFCP